jgi:hypothetical protein
MAILVDQINNGLWPSALALVGIATFAVSASIRPHGATSTQITVQFWMAY